MSELQQFLHMGGYAPFVWSAYGLWLILLTWMLLAALARGRRVRRALSQRFRLEALQTARQHAADNKPGPIGEKHT